MPRRLSIVLVALFLIAALLGPVIYANTRSAQENRSAAVSPQAQDAAPRVDKGAPPDAADPGAAPQTGQKAGENSSEAAGSGDLKVEEEKAGKRAGEAEENKARDDGTGRKAP
ncbi:MAG: hypothetical protein H5T99_00940, partial [Moorella sp. (in: Bacteria)]|nr:hypothetical protein [Moorella sp. (in: firmicutes)]